MTVTSLSFTQVYAASLGVGNDSTTYQISGDGNWDGSLQTSCTPTDADASNPIPAAADTLCLARRSVAIALAGQLSGDSGVTLALDTEVKVKNDALDATP